jgi:hypothetical protein
MRANVGLEEQSPWSICRQCIFISLVLSLCPSGCSAKNSTIECKGHLFIVVRALNCMTTSSLQSHYLLLYE